MENNIMIYLGIPCAFILMIFLSYFMGYVHGKESVTRIVTEILNEKSKVLIKIQALRKFFKEDL